MNSFSKKAAKAMVSTAILGSLLFTATACDNGNQPAASDTASPVASQSETPAPLSTAAQTAAPVDNTLTQAQKDAILKDAADKPLGIDPASVPVPADVKRAFPEASANLVRDALVFQAGAQGFKQLQVFPLGTPESITAGVTQTLGPLTMPETLASLIKDVNSPDGTPVIPGFTQDQATNGIVVDGKVYHAIGQGVLFNKPTVAVSLAKETMPLTQNDQTIQVPLAHVTMEFDITVPCKEGTVVVPTKVHYNFTSTPDGHWLLQGYTGDATLTVVGK